MFSTSKEVPRTIVVSGQGYIGRSFANYYKNYEPNTLITHHLPIEGSLLLDLKNPNKKFSEISLENYRYGLIAAGCARMSVCEKHPGDTAACNVFGTLNLVKEFLENRIIPIVFSTDYVFDGRDGAYDENAIVSPLNEYGRQKAELESQILNLYSDNVLIVRLGKVFGTSFGDRTMLDEMASAFSKGQNIRAAYDQVFCPIHINDVVRAVIALQKLNKRGLYNLCGEEVISRYDLAIRLCDLLGTSSKLVDRISLNELGENFIRPKNTSMISNKLRKETKMKFTSIEDSLKVCVLNYSESL